MTVYVLLLLKLSIALITSLLVVALLRHSLRRVLGKICPDEEASGFWVIYTMLMLVLVPLLFVLMMDFFAETDHLIDGLRLTLIAILGGLLLGLYFIGSSLSEFVAPPKQQEDKS